MCLRFAGVLFCAAGLATAVIIDRIAVKVGNSIVKDSDISRDLRVTDFLNGDALNLSERARRTAANRLIDQIFIRKEIELGDYPVASPEQADHEIDSLVQQRFKSEAALQNDLRQYGITAPDLRSHFRWQLTVLRFIDVRFRPAVFVTDKDVQSYYAEHLAELRREHPNRSSLDDVRREITDAITGERVNKVFFTWLDDQRKQAKIVYLEAGLQ